MMKTPFTLTQVLIPAVAAVIAIAPAKAAGPLTVSGDLNNDGLLDTVVVTSPTTITVSLANWFGDYTISAILSTPKKQQISAIGLTDHNGDGVLDVYANCPAGGGWTYTHLWSGTGDGTFGARTTEKWIWPPKGNYGSW